MQESDKWHLKNNRCHLLTQYFLVSSGTDPDKQQLVRCAENLALDPVFIVCIYIISKYKPLSVSLAKVTFPSYPKATIKFLEEIT